MTNVTYEGAYLDLGSKSVPFNVRADVTRSVNKSSRAKGVNPEEEKLALGTPFVLVCFPRILKLH